MTKSIASDLASGRLKTLVEYPPSTDKAGCTARMPTRKGSDRKSGSIRAPATSLRSSCGEMMIDVPDPTACASELLDPMTMPHVISPPIM